MPDDVISRQVFEKRLIVICVRSQLEVLPKKFHDRHILLKALTMSLAPDRSYAEVEFNAALNAWARSSTNLDIDHATVRRALIDYRYIVRNRSGSEYRVNDEEPGGVAFEPGVAEISVTKLLDEAQADIERRRAEARQRS